MQEIKSDLTSAQDYVQVHQHVNQSKGLVGLNQFSLHQQPFAKLTSNQLQQSMICGQHEFYYMYKLY